MELSIDYACPECYRLHTVDLLEISPGKVRYCSHCKTPLVLTEETLHNFADDLQRLSINLAPIVR